MLDGSQSVSANSFNAMKLFTRAAISAYNLSITGTRVAVASYGSDVTIPQNFSLSKESLYAELTNIVAPGGSRRIDLALDCARKGLFFKSRPDSNKVIVVFAEGTSDVTGLSQLTHNVQMLQSDGIEIAVIGIGQSARALKWMVKKEANFMHTLSVNNLYSYIHDVLLLSMPAKGQNFFFKLLCTHSANLYTYAGVL